MTREEQIKQYIDKLNSGDLVCSLDECKCPIQQDVIDLSLPLEEVVLQKRGNTWHQKYKS